MEKINIFYTCDNKFAQHCAVSIASLLYNANSDDDIAIFIIHSDIANPTQKKFEKLKQIKDFKLEFISIDDTVFSKYQTPDYINSSASLYRYLIPNVKPELKKAIYLDSDTIIRHSLSELYNLNTDNYYIAGVEDWHEGMCIKRLKLNSSINEPYFNSGVLLINCEKWRNDDFFTKLLAQTNNLNPKMLEQLDQDAINILTTGKKLLLHPKYNLLSCYTDMHIFSKYSAKELAQAEADPVIVHYTAAIKPWMTKNFPLNKFAYEYHKYIKITPYEIKHFKLNVCIFNPKVRKYLQKLKKNTFCKLIFDFILLFFQVLGLISGILSIKKYSKLFDKETLL